MASPIWQRSSGLYVFHHTDPESAENIATVGPMIVGAGNLLGPTGVHAGSDDPEAVSLDWVCANYFFNLWPLEALGGVVVFKGDDPDQPFQLEAATTWVLPAPVGPLIVTEIVAGWGAIRPDGSWDWSPGLLL